MGILLDNPKTITCRICGRGWAEGEEFFGQRMWHSWQPTCRHERFYTCPDCDWQHSDKVSCSVCGNGGFYT